MIHQYSLFDTLLEPVFVLNAEQNVVYCNETASIVAGLSIRKITRGMKFLDLFQFSEPIESLNHLADITDATPYKEVNFLTSQGGEGKVQITLQPISGTDGERNWIVFVRDVTLEERLQKKYRAELEQKEGVIKALEEAKIQLENYSKNLEQMVADRTRELSRLNQTMTALLDSLGQGFFIFNSEGTVLDVSSKACELTVECKPEGRLIWDVLKLPENKVDGFKKWMQTVFMEMLPFEDLAPLGPAAFDHSAGRHISLEYNPLRSTEGSIEGVVVVASDITSLVEAQRQAETEKEHAKLIINLIKNKREVLRFIGESQTLLTDIRRQTSDQKTVSDIEGLYRSLHTLKGGAALFSVQEVSNTCHEAENLLTAVKENSFPEALQKLQGKCVEVETAFHHFLEETKTILGPTALTEERHIEIPLSELKDLIRQVEFLPGGAPVAESLQQNYLMEPITHFLEPYNEVMQSLAVRVEKSLKPLAISAANIQVVPEIYGPLLATLVHAFRNAVDHGIESPDVRTERGKPTEGQVEIAVSVLKSANPPVLRLVIKDDGGGINPVKIRSLLEQKGRDVSQENDQEIIQHIFDSQFSTRTEVTEISGRGVGMDAIKFAAEELQGRVWVESVVGQGTTLFVEVPYLTENFTRTGKSPLQAA